MEACFAGGLRHLQQQEHRDDRQGGAPHWPFWSGAQIKEKKNGKLFKCVCIAQRQNWLLHALPGQVEWSAYYI